METRKLPLKEMEIVEGGGGCEGIQKMSAVAGLISVGLLFTTGPGGAVFGILTSPIHVASAMCTFMK